MIIKEELHIRYDQGKNEELLSGKSNRRLIYSEL